MERRLILCVQNWPDAQTGEYNPSCCRWPKSCSASVYDPAFMTDADLEPEVKQQIKPESRSRPVERISAQVLVSVMIRQRGTARDPIERLALDKLAGSLDIGYDGLSALYLAELDRDRAEHGQIDTAPNPAVPDA